MRRSSLIASIVPALVAGTLASAPLAVAAPPPPMTVTVQSSSGATGNYFRLSGSPGQRLNAGTLNLRNQTTRRITVRLDPVGALTASTLGSAYKLRSTAPRGTARWAAVSRRRVTLAPRGSARIPVSVRVPSSAGPGDYLAGISVQSGDSADEVQRGNVAIASIQRYAVGVFVSLPGPRNPKLKLTGVQLKREPAGVTFSILGRNSGNVILQNVRGRATVTTGDRKVASVRLGPGTFVTDTSIAYPVLVPSERPAEGTAYRVRAFMRYRGGVARIDRQVRFGEIDAMRQEAYGGPQASSDDGRNLLPILLILLAVGAAGAAAYLWRRRSVGDRAAHRSLQRAIVAARANDEPLSVIGVLPENGGGASPASAVRERLRRSDRLLRLRGSGLLVVAPDTTPEAGETLAAEIRRHLERRQGGSYRVVPVLDASASTPEELLDATVEGNGGGMEKPAARDDGGTHSPR